MAAYEMSLDPLTITAEGFYQHRREVIERQWETDAETAYREAMETQVEKPPILPTLHILDDWIARISNKYAK